MVAKAGRGWKLAPSLVALVAEADKLAPNRIRKADGSIGDAAHSARTSDHNPSNGWVCAVDLTHAPASGFDAHARARLSVARQDRRIKYVISNRQIAKSYVSRGVPAWQWAPYTGSNPHTFHAHFSIHNTPEARGDCSPWWPHSAPEPEDDDAMDPRAFVVLTYLTVLGRKPESLKVISDGVTRIKNHPGGEREGQNAYLVSVIESPEGRKRWS